MCPCPFCTGLLILLCPFLLFKRSRNWLKNKVLKHHTGCCRCQHAEHESHQKDRTPCTCNSCCKKNKEHQK